MNCFKIHIFVNEDFPELIQLTNGAIRNALPQPPILDFTVHAMDKRKGIVKWSSTLTGNKFKSSFPNIHIRENSPQIFAQKEHQMCKVFSHYIRGKAPTNNKTFMFRISIYFDLWIIEGKQAVANLWENSYIKNHNHKLNRVQVIRASIITFNQLITGIRRKKIWSCSILHKNK